MMEPLPAYVEDQVPQNAFDALLTRISLPIDVTLPRHPNARVVLESYVESQKAPAYNVDDAANVQSPSPISEYPADPDSINVVAPDPILLRVKQRIVEEFFRAIEREEDESVALLIQNNLVTANTTNRAGGTPLLAAISANVMPIVKQLLDLGADPNAFGQVWDLAPGEGVLPIGVSTRTPLMLAASQGSLPIVKLLFEEPYRADDALVAPDGQIALRLAAASGHAHAAVVTYLPSRRAGGFLRFKAANAVNIARTRKAARGIYRFIKFFVWYTPKFFLWSLPKHLMVLPVVNSCKWCWGNRKKFAQWCKYQVMEAPKRLVRAGKAILKGVKKTPEFVRDCGKGIWRFGKDSAIWLWKLCTVRIPQAAVIALKWIGSGLRTLGIAAWSIIASIASFLHTVLLAIVTFFRGLTLRDIWNAFYDVLHAVFVTLPTTLLSWAKNFGRVSYRFMEALFGSFGELLWWVVALLGHVVVYVPVKVWIIIQSIGSSLAKAAHEVMVCINPKA